MTGNRQGRARRGRSVRHRGGMMMKVAAAFTGLLLLTTAGSMVYAGIDAPHNEARGINCGSCHDASGLFNSPFWDPAAAPTEYNAICESCHTEASIVDTGTTDTDLYPGIVAPKVLTHSSTTTTATHGSWAVRCVDCHEPHAQDQKMWHRTDAANMFLATGTVASYTAGPVNATGPTSVYTYTPPITFKSPWTAAAIIEKTTPERRPLFFPASNYLAANYPVLNIDEVNHTITVQGDVTPLYSRGFTATNFAIEYGQAIKRYISGTFNNTVLTNKEVRFFDKTGLGSFAYDESGSGLDPNVNGICQVCHTQTVHFKNDGTISAGTHSSRSGVKCTTCHLHSAGFAGGADHTGWVTNTNTPSCTTSCHTINTSPFTGAGEVHAVNGCATCHVGTPKLKANGGVFVATVDTILPADSANGCGECHSAIVGDWYQHQVAHDTRAAGVAPCTDCHTGTAGNTTTMPTSSADDKIHDACSTCHQADGSLQPASGYASAMNPGNNSCTTCHGAGYFDSHVHGADSAGYVVHDVAFSATVDISQDGSAGNECYQCHDDAGLGSGTGALGTWVAIKTEHATVGGTAQSSTCATCHDYATSGNQSGDADTPLLSTVQTTISSATGVTCVTCHLPKSFAASPTTSTHGGHPVDFGKDAQCTTCHTGANVVKDIHANTCSVCHSGAPSATSEKIGDALNGVDGDATLANGTAAGGTWSSVTCLTCHPIATYDLSTVHHDSKNGYAAAGNCVQCHTGVNYPGDHTLRVADTTNCNTCHTATAGSATGVPVDPAVNATANKVHDACTTCHNTDADATLKAAYGYASAMPDGGVGSNNGGGDCNACHGAYFVNHSNMDHTGKVDVIAPCGSCHTATAGGAAGLMPVDATSGTKVHDACATCHNVTTGALNGGTTTYGGQTLSAGDCGTCHTATYFGSHTHGHSVTASVTCATATCHDTTGSGGIARAADATPFIGAGQVHATGTCDNCHDVTTKLLKVGSNGKGDATVNGGAGGDCVACHINGNAYTGWSDIHTAKAATNHATHVTTAANCTTVCHDGTAGPGNARIASSTPFAGVGEVHAAGCTACHTGTNDGALVAAPAKADTVASGNCETCHAATSTWTTIHTGATGLDHTGRVDGLVSCTTCHTGTAGGASGSMPITNADNKVHDACSTCHTTNGLPLVSTPTPNGWASSVAAGDCGTCHGAAYFDSHDHGLETPTYTSGHDVALRANDLAQADPGTPCSDCHTPAGGLTSWTGIVNEHSGACGTCHSYATNGNQTGAVDTPLLATVESSIATGTTVGCITCHTAKEHPATHGGHSASHFGFAGNCNSCHTGVEVVKDIHSNNCDLCHTGGTYNATTNGAGPSANGVDGDASLAEGAATAATPFDPTVYTCLTCHTPGGSMTATSTGGIHHDHADASFGSNCTTSCHSAATTGAKSNAHDTRIQTEANCSSCHTGIAGTTTTAPTSQSSGTIHDTCVTCHTITGPGYAAVRVTVSPAKRGLPAAQIPVGGGTCSTCHTATPFRDYHHESAPAQAGACTTCHNQSLVGATAPAQMGCRECHVDETQNGIAVFSYRLSLGDGTQPTSMVNKSDATAGTDASGYVTSHSITGTSPIAIADYQACMDCHSRGNTPIDAQGGLAAPVIAPFHGYPGDPVSGYIETGMGLFTNKTFIGTGSPYTGLDEVTNTNNANSLPLAFMYYHPGHISFRRFGETATMTRRSGANGYGDNGQLYRNNGNYANAIRGNSYVAATVEDYVRKAGNTWAGGECTHGGGNNFNTGTNLDIACLERKTGAGLDHETPVTGYASRINIPYTNFGTTSSGATAYDGGYGTTANVPYFTDVVTPSLPDNVYVNSAEVDINGDLQVSAGNDDGCTVLSVWADGTTNLGTMSGTSPNCTFTSAAINPVPTTVDVQTTNAQGVNVTGYPVTDNSNAIPAAVNDTVNVAVETVYAGDVTVNNGNGVDSLGDTPSTIALVADVPGGEGTLTLNSDGTFSYDPGTSFIGTTSFTYNITDSTPDTSNTATVSITVSNTVPVAVVDTFSTQPGVVITSGDVSGNDTLGEPVNTFNLVTNVTLGTLTWYGDGTFDFDPGTMVDGDSTTFDYSITDGKPSASPDTSLSVTVTINVSANSAPVATNDAFTFNHTVGLQNLAVVLADNGNGIDSDADGDPMTINSVGTPSSGGTAVINADNVTIDYTPSGTFAGTETFTYTITDGAATSNTATVSVTLSNTAPAAVDDAFTVTQDTTDNVLAVMAANPTTADSDADGDTITLSTVVSPTTQGGTATISGADILYTPPAGFTGTDTFTYTINDGFVDSASATVTVTVDASAMTSSSGETLAGMMPLQNFPTTGSTTIDITVQVANVGDKKNYWSLFDDGNNTAQCSGSFSTGDNGLSWSSNVDFNACGASAGLYFMEIAIEDNSTGDKYKIKYLPITLGTTTEYLKIYSDSGYSTETTSFGYTDTVYVEINSAALHSFINGSPNAGGSSAKVADFADTKHLKAGTFSTFTYQGGTTYRFSYNVSDDGVAYPSGTTNWYQSELKPNNTSKIGIMLEITTP